MLENASQLKLLGICDLLSSIHVGEHLDHPSIKPEEGVRSIASLVLQMRCKEPRKLFTQVLEFEGSHRDAIGIS